MPRQVTFAWNPCQKQNKTSTNFDWNVLDIVPPLVHLGRWICVDVELVFRVAAFLWAEMVCMPFSFRSRFRLEPQDNRKSCPERCLICQCQLWTRYATRDICQTLWTINLGQLNNGKCTEKAWEGMVSWAAVLVEPHLPKLMRRGLKNRWCHRLLATILFSYD